MIVFKGYGLEFYIKNKPQIYIIFNLDKIIGIDGNETIIHYYFPVIISVDHPV